MEGPLNILPRIEQGNRATVRATCWMLSLCEFLEQPSHAGRVERGVDFDGRMAGNGRSNAGAQRAKILILRGLIGVATGLFYDFGQSSLKLGSLQPDWRCFDRKCLRAKGFNLKAVAFKFLGNARKHDHLPGL